MTNHAQHQQQHQWQPAPPTHHDNGQWKGHDGYKDSHGNTYDSGHWKGHDGYKDSHGNTYDSGHWKGNDAYPPHHHQGAPVRDTNGNPVPPGESTILPIQNDAGQHQGHHGRWQQDAPAPAQMRDEQGNVLQPGEFSTLPLPGQVQMRDEQGNVLQPGEFSTLPLPDQVQMRDEQGNVLQPGEFSTLPLPGQVQMRDEQGNVLQPGEFSTLPVPDQFADQHSWHAGAGGHAQQDAAGGQMVHHGTDFFVTADGQVGGASSVSWEPSAAATPDVGGEFQIMSSTMG